MALDSGTRLGAYEILALIGTGGMGEVYKARDTKLIREVAIKVLPPLFTRDPERLARFRREAQVLAALNHPHIAHIHGLEEVGGIEFLILELVEGETLADRIRRGPLPLEEALPIAQQIGDALSAAHEKGIIHRDLKPANIALTADGQVKVLDFGLAKALESDLALASPEMSAPPTITSPAMTALGVILGTAAYMAPEQAKGRAADKRSDIWAFGCVLYEMLTGKRAFDGDDVSDTLAGILRGEPDWKALPTDLPPAVRTAVTMCLAKDPRRRFADISTPLFLLSDMSQTLPLATPASGAPAVGRRRTTILIALVAIASIVLTGIAAWILRPSTPRPSVTRFSVPLGDGEYFSNLGRQEVAISRDGSRIAYVANVHLYVRYMNDPVPHILSTGDTQRDSITSPVFSPDGQAIAYWSSSDNAVKRLPTGGGTPLTLCRANNPYGMTWQGDSILFGAGAGGIMSVSENGGTPVQIAKVGSAERAYGPQLLPDGDHILFSVTSDNGPSGWDHADIVTESITTGERRTIVRGAADGRYVATGHLLYAVGGVLMAAPFDPGRLALTGPASPALEGVRRGIGGATGVAQFSTSDTGTLAFIEGPASAKTTLSTIGIITRDGRVEELTPAPPVGNYEYPRVSPDGRWLAVGKEEDQSADIWICDLSGRTAPRRLTFGGRNRAPVWSGDGNRVIFQSDREGDTAVFWQRADGAGTAERLTRPESGTAHTPESASADGKWLLVTVTQAGRMALDVLSVADRTLKPFDDVRDLGYTFASFSPDGTLVAYVGPGGTFVQPFPPTGARYLVEPGIHPFWSRDGKELFVSPRSGFAVVTITKTPTFAFGTPTELNRPWLEPGPPFERNIDIMPDGQHFAAIVGPRGSAINGERVDVVINWFEELKTRLGVH